MKRVLLATAAILVLCTPAFAQTPAPDAPKTDAGKTDAGKTDKADKPKWDVRNPPGYTLDLKLDVREGSWMALDVSPDGKEVVFDLMGDLYVMPITGGEARNIASGISWDMQPTYSPDGKQIAFTSDRGGGDNLWVMNRDGSDPKAVSSETFRLLSQPAWTPDGQFIVGRKHFTSGRSLGAGEMWMYHRAGAGGAGVQLTERRTQQKDSGEPAFSPDGRYLYYSDDVTAGGVFEYSKDPNTEIYAIQRLDRETGETRKFLGGPGGAIRPTPSPDGKSLAFIRRVRYQSVLYVMDIASGAETKVYDHLDRDMQETWAIHGAYPAMSWTPDGKSIVFWAGGKIQRVDVASKAVTDIPFHVADTRKAREAVRFPVNVAPDSFDVKMIRWAKTSPDGSKVVFEALGSLWIRDLPNGTQRRLTKQTNHFELYPSWSRDGKSIVYTTWNDDELGSIRVISAAGGEGRKVNKNPGRFVEPVFSPDGKTIVYRTSTDGILLSSLWTRDPGIYRVATTGGDPVLISDKGGAPQFGASNDRVYFTGRQDKLIALKSADLNGHDVRTHLTSEFASEFAVSPDEAWVAWNERFNAYVAPFAKSGRAISVAVDGKAIPQAKVTRDAGDWVHWSGDSRTLRWSLGPELFSRDLKQSFSFVEGAPAELPKPPEAGINLGFKQAAYKPSGRVALTGARLVTMKGDEVIEDGVVVLNGNRIEAIGPRASVTVPADAKVMDMTGKTITPGLIDAHWHGSMGSDEIIPQRSWVNYAALAFGVTTIHDPSNDTSEIFAASELEKAGTIVGPRIFSTGTILYGAATPFTAKIESVDDALGTLRRMKAVGAWSVKSYNQPRREQRQQIIEAANQLGVMVVPEGGSLFEHNMTMVLDGHTTVEHSLPLAHIYADVKQIWPQTKVAYTPTLIVAYGGAFGENYWYQESKVYDDPRLTQYVPRRLLDNRARRPVLTPDEELNHISIAREATTLGRLGVSVQIGAHGQREGLGAHWELWGFVQGGMTPMEALHVGTINGAKALGMDKDLGSLEPASWPT
jgi:Tol biopolymer transport system component/imidazolonepropionase-like amidohydrolase